MASAHLLLDFSNPLEVFNKSEIVRIKFRIVMQGPNFNLQNSSPSTKKNSRKFPVPKLVVFDMYVMFWPLW